jgi:large subunit ribosomal protein L21
MYAIIEASGKQLKVAPGDKIEVNRLAVEPGQTVVFDRVLLVNDGSNVKVGQPTVPNAVVVADVLENKRGPKVIAFKFRRREGYHRKVGHRQELTVLQIKEIRF